MEKRPTVYINDTTGGEMFNHKYLAPLLESRGYTPIVGSTYASVNEEQRNAADYVLYVVSSSVPHEVFYQFATMIPSIIKERKQTLVLAFNELPPILAAFGKMKEALEVAYPNVHCFFSTEELLQWLSGEIILKDLELTRMQEGELHSEYKKFKNFHNYP